MVLDHPMFVGGESLEGYLEERQVRVEEHITECMAQKGFDYQWIPPDVVAVESVDADVAGFGIVDAHLLLLESSSLDAVDDQAQQPGVSAAEAEEFRLALDGVDLDAPLEAFVPESCRGQAFDEVIAPDDAVLQAVRSELATLDDRVAADPRIISLRSDWSACMEQLGYEYADRHSVVAGVVDEVNAVAARFNTAIESERMAMREALLPLRDEEVALAGASEECAEELDAQYPEIAEEYNEQFLEERGERIAELLEGQ